MATIQKVNNKKGISYRVLIRNKGLRGISKTFPRKRLAVDFIHQMDCDAKARVNYNIYNKKNL